MGGPFENPDATAWEEFAYYTGCWMLYGHGLWTIELRSTPAAIGFVHLAIEWDDVEPELGWHLIARRARPRPRQRSCRPSSATCTPTEAAPRRPRLGLLALLPGFVSYVPVLETERFVRGYRPEDVATFAFYATDGPALSAAR
jgi:hypothetical protein